MTEIKILLGFLDRVSINALEDLADDPNTQWEPGRQGTGYEKASVRWALSSVFLGPPIRRALDLLESGMWNNRWDAWLLRYPDGSRVPSHRDPAPAGLRHARLNAVIRAPSLGGVFVAGGREYELEPGDAVLFSPDEVEHEVTAVAGQRVMLSVGAYLRSEVPQ